MIRPLIVALSIVVLTAEAGCGNTREYGCPALAFEGPQLLYPAPGATGVPTAAAALLLAGSAPTGTSPQLVAAGQTLTLSFGPAPSPLPSPRATPFSGNEPLEGAAYPTLSSKTTYALAYASVSDGSCVFPVGAQGSFTTK
jgi:hypothetical protein